MIRKARELSPNLKSEFGSPSDHCVMCISQFVGGHVGGRGSGGGQLVAVEVQGVNPSGGNSLG